MTQDEKSDWLKAIATQADTLFAEPEDMLWITGVLLLWALSRLPKSEQLDALDKWNQHVSRCLCDHSAFETPHVSRR